MASKTGRSAAAAAVQAGARERSLRQARRRRHWALWALLFPLIFTTVIAIGLAAMFYKRMEFFRPAHATAAPWPCCTGLIQSGARPHAGAQA